MQIWLLITKANQSPVYLHCTDILRSWSHFISQRKLDESDFTQKKGALSESTLQSNPSLKLQWSSNARRSLKQQMPLKHLDKHSLDSEGSMHCHRLNPKASTLNNFDRNIYCLNITKLYVVLAIALNLVEDDINLLDLLRFIDEEHLTSRYMLQYLPDNVAMHGKTLIKQMEFGHQEDKCRYKVRVPSFFIFAFPIIITFCNLSFLILDFFLLLLSIILHNLIKTC